jgi:hypothetical protein
MKTALALWAILLAAQTAHAEVHTVVVRAKQKSKPPEIKAAVATPPQAGPSTAKPAAALTYQRGFFRRILRGNCGPFGCP